MKLIDNWKQALNFWSIRLSAIGTALSALFIAAPDSALFAWNSLPQDLKDAIPENYLPWLSVGILVLSMFARIIKQEKLHAIDKTTG